MDYLIKEIRNKTCQEICECFLVYRWLCSHYWWQEFERSCEEVNLKKENLGFFDGSFLHLGIKIKHGKINIQLYDKRDDFLYSIVEIPQLTSKIP